VPRNGRRLKAAQATDVSAESHYSALANDLFKSSAEAVSSRFSCQSLKLVISMFKLVTLSCDDQDILDFKDYLGTSDEVLKRELDQYKIFVTSNSIIQPLRIEDAVDLFRRNEALGIFLPNIRLTLQTYLTLPCTSCEAERSFSCLRRLLSPDLFVVDYDAKKNESSGYLHHTQGRA